LKPQLINNFLSVETRVGPQTRAEAKEWNDLSSPVTALPSTPLRPHATPRSQVPGNTSHIKLVIAKKELDWSSPPKFFCASTRLIKSNEGEDSPQFWGLEQKRLPVSKDGRLTELFYVANPDQVPVVNRDPPGPEHKTPIAIVRNRQPSAGAQKLNTPEDLKTSFQSAGCVSERVAQSAGSKDEGNPRQRTIWLDVKGHGGIRDSLATELNVLHLLKDGLQNEAFVHNDNYCAIILHCEIDCDPLKCVSLNADTNRDAVLAVFFPGMIVTFRGSNSAALVGEVGLAVSPCAGSICAHIYTHT